MCPHERAHWRRLANTIELTVCCGDAVLDYFHHLLGPTYAGADYQSLGGHCELTGWHVLSCSETCMLITFRVSCRRCEMYCGHMRLCVWLFISDIAIFVLKRDVKLQPTMCVSVCMSVCPRPHAYTIARTPM